MSRRSASPPCDLSDASCTALQGVNVNLSNYYMLHVWVLDDMMFEPDVFAGMIPCIANGTAVHDANDPCHKSRTMAGMAATGEDMSGHDMAGMEGMAM